LRARLLSRADDVRRRLIDDGVVKRLEPNSNSSCHNFLSSLFALLENLGFYARFPLPSSRLT
jgi:hypothetical protein